MLSFNTLLISAAVAVQPVNPDGGRWGVQPGDNGLTSDEHCLPFAECMPVEECIQFVYTLDLAAHEAEESAIEAICFHGEEEKG